MAWALSGNIAGKGFWGGNPGSGNLMVPSNLISTAVGSPTSGYMTLMPLYVAESTTIKAMAINCTTAVVTPAAGFGVTGVLYADDGSNAKPLVTSAGLLASVSFTSVVTSTGIKIVALASNVTLSPGLYWVGVIYYQGSAAPGTPAQYTYASNGVAIWALSTAFQLNACIRRTGLTSATPPTDGVIGNPSANTVTSVIVGLQPA